MSKRADFWIGVFLFYMFGAGMTMAFMDILAPINPSNAEFFGIVVLWPLFAIKYILIGIWLVLSAGFGLLI